MMDKPLQGGHAVKYPNITAEMEELTSDEIKFLLLLRAAHKRVGDKIYDEVKRMLRGEEEAHERKRGITESG